MIQKTKGIDKSASIVIVGAGPGGLSTAWFLSKNGFHNVTVLEKLGRVGGLSKSITVDGSSFDIGANYVTWAYRETLAIAKEVGATTYYEKKYTSLEVNDELTKYKFRDLDKAMLWNYYTKEKIKKSTFIFAAIRYLYIRWKLNATINVPGYLDTIKEHPELCVSFKEWLTKHNLMALSAMFQFPITIMGYCQLEDIATPYALRYMSFRTVLPMVFGSSFISCFIGKWPKRFHFGFQRLWQRVAWRTNVRLNVKIEEIDRSGEQIKITMKYPHQDMNDIEMTETTQYYDYLIIACPLTVDVFVDQLNIKLNKYEEIICPKVKPNPYCMTTFWVNNMQMDHPIAPVLPVPKRGIPWAIARQFQNDGNMFTQFYTRPAEGQSKEEVINTVRKMVNLLDGDINDDQARWHTYDKFTYFQHFTVDEIKGGIYNTVAEMQGFDKTFYVGGPTDFDLIEPIVNHSKYIVEKHFVGSLTS